MGNYISVAQVQAYKVTSPNGPETLDLTAYTDADIEERIGFAENTIELVTNDVFYVKTEINKFDGNGLPKLFFIPSIPYKLLSITSVKEYDIDGTTLLDTYVENTDFKRYDYYLEMAKVYAGDSPRRRFGNYGVWPKGQKNISVQGTWGNTTTPPLIKKAALILTLESLVPGCTQTPTKDVPSITWNDFRVDFAYSDVKGESTGNLEVDRILQRFINNSSMFLVIPDTKQSYDSNTIRLM